MQIATRLKIYIKINNFSFPIPALRFATIRWLAGHALKLAPQSNVKEEHGIPHFAKKIRVEDIDNVIDKLRKEPPFEMADIKTYDEKNRKVIIKVYTL